MVLTPTREQWASVRSRLIGYNDAALTTVKEALADELNCMDLEVVLAERFGLELCAGCGYWFDKRDCSHYNGRGGYECQSCAA